MSGSELEPERVLSARLPGIYLLKLPVPPGFAPLDPIEIEFRKHPLPTVDVELSAFQAR